MNPYKDYTGRYCSIELFFSNNKSERTEIWKGTILAQTEHGIYITRLNPEMAESPNRLTESEELFFPWNAIQKISFPLTINPIIEQLSSHLRDIRGKYSLISTCLETDQQGRMVVNGLGEKEPPKKAIKRLRKTIKEEISNQKKELKQAGRLQPHELRRIIFILEKQEQLLGDIPELCDKTKELLADIHKHQNSKKAS